MMENERAIQILHETKIQYENSIADESDPDAVDALKSNTEVVIAINTAITALERYEELQQVIKAFISVCHNGSGMCEFCKTDCISAGTDDKETFQCGCFEYNGKKPEGQECFGIEADQDSPVDETDDFIINLSIEELMHNGNSHATQIMSKSLKPCLHCEEGSGQITVLNGFIVAQCDNCGVIIVGADLTEDGAIDAWNRRPDDEAEKPMKNYIGYVKTDTMLDPETFEFEVSEDATEEEIDSEAKAALWGSGIIDWWYAEETDDVEIDIL